MGVWDDLERRLEVHYTSGDEVGKPKPEDLDQFEQESGFRLPVEYREFALTFGPGTFGRGWQFSTPGFSDIQSYENISRLNKRFHSQGLYPGFFLFCGKEDFHGWFAWNSEDVTDPDKHEYGIYLLLNDPPVKVASTFHEFVMFYALGGVFERQEEGDQGNEPDDSDMTGPIGFSQVLA